MSSLEHLSSATLRILISETKGALNLAEVAGDAVAAREYAGVMESFRRHGDDWKLDFADRLSRYESELESR